MVLGIVLGFVFLYIGFVYSTHAADNLPTYFPGYLQGSTHVHAKHAIASFIVAVACFIFAWFKSGPKTTT